MKIFYYLGLTIFGIGIILFFVREFNESIVSAINPFLIDILWPIGLMIYSLALIFVNKEKKSKA